MINLTWLQTFCTLIETGHFTRTAEKLTMTQPGVTQHIQKLEQSLRHALIHREGKSFRLTEAGEKVYKQGLLSLSQLREMEESLNVDNPFVGRCRIASPGSLGLKLYPQLLNWQQQHPALQIDFEVAPNHSIEKNLEEQKLDIGLITRAVKSPSLICRPLAAEHLCLVTSSDVKAVDWPTLLELGYINHPDGAHHATLLLGANYREFARFDQLPHRGFSNQIGMILEPVSRSLGFTVLPAHAVAAFPHQQAICSHKLDIPVSETIYLAQQKWDILPKRLNKVVELITQELAGDL
ncbi:LysR family transcriptional regulator [Sansalvadorimonas verongulae]|uniref:LysR family transcriptional regulator n=1 Tax=Sansalvadorimonas verongulae TaxID=2172824 RepID=UPI0012BB63AF|nr:LysR family transcriptional regulator [Sansalvadorimonas verongulae]MTI14415.1 LysR family transcriptional regulator [Sansalvadorimonas verongulae]